MTQNAPGPRPPRLLSLDALRGFTIIGMLLVNNKPVQFHPQLDHAPWGKFPTFTDMIFPWFLFMVGCALPFARASRISRGVPLKRYYLKVIQRAAMLFFLGCMIYTVMNWTHGKPTVAISLGGVLQPIGVAYLIAAFIYELRPFVRYSITADILIIYWIIMRFLPAPGIPAGTFEENHNVLAWFNQAYLAPIKLPWLYEQGLVSGISFAGLPSMFPMAALVLIGTFAGELMRSTRTAVQKLKILVAAGLVLTAGGLIWHLDLMMNKEYWTPSYILFTAGLAMFLLAIFYFLLDARLESESAGSIAPRVVPAWAILFIVYGMNAITAYFISIVVRTLTLDWIHVPFDGRSVSLKEAIWSQLARSFPWHIFPADPAATVGHALYMILYIGFWWLVLYGMYRKGWFWRV